MKQIKWDRRSPIPCWWVKDSFEERAKKSDRITYQHIVAQIAKAHLVGKDVLELFGGVGMSTVRYSKHARTVTRIDIDPETNELARMNLKGLDNVVYIEDDFLEAVKKLRKKYHFIDADNYTAQETDLFNNLPWIAKQLRKDAVGFLFGDNYQFILSRNFRHNFPLLEEKFGIRFKEKAQKHTKERCRIFHEALAEAILERFREGIGCSDVWMFRNVARLLFLDKGIYDGPIRFHRCYNRAEIEKIIGPHLVDLMRYV